MYSERIRVLSLTLLTGVVLTACTTPDHSPQIAYHEARDAGDLEVPPDLVRPQAATALRIPGIETQAIPLEFHQLEMVRSGDVEWIEAHGVAPEQIWPRLNGFFRAQGLAVEREAPELGIIDSGWAVRQDGPTRGGLTGLMDRLFSGETEVRDRYRIRLERMPGGEGTRIFLTHWDAAETRVEDARGQQSPEFDFRRSRGDPAVRAEMTQRLLVHLGITEARARALMADDAVRQVFAPAIHYRESDNGRGEAFVPGGDPDRVRRAAIDGLDDIQAELSAADDDDARYRVIWVPPGQEGRSGLFGIGRRAAQRVEIEMQVQQVDDEVRILARNGDPNVTSQFMKYLVDALGGDVDVEPLSRDRLSEDPAQVRGAGASGPPGQAGHPSGR